MINKRYVIGIDFGSDSARALLLDSANGTKLAEASSLYPRWGKKKYCNEELAQYRQHPQDYIDALESVLGSLSSFDTSDTGILSIWVMMS